MSESFEVYTERKARTMETDRIFTLLNEGNFFRDGVKEIYKEELLRRGELCPSCEEVAYSTRHHLKCRTWRFLSDV